MMLPRDAHSPSAGRGHIMHHALPPIGMSKAMSKKKIDHADLALAFVQGQLKKLPILFLTAGELTKKAKEMLQKDFKGMNVADV